MTPTSGEGLWPDVEVGGQRLYQVLVEEKREKTFFVAADDETAAKRDAAELADGVDWDDVDSDISVWNRTLAPSYKYAQVWVGGKKGDWHNWCDLA